MFKCWRVSKDQQNNCETPGCQMVSLVKTEADGTEQNDAWAEVNFWGGAHWADGDSDAKLWLKSCLSFKAFTREEEMQNFTFKNQLKCFIISKIKFNVKRLWYHHWNVGQSPWFPKSYLLKTWSAVCPEKIWGTWTNRGQINKSGLEKYLQQLNSIWRWCS